LARKNYPDEFKCDAGALYRTPRARRPRGQELARLRAEVKALRATEARLSTERDILRLAAMYFAGETNW
jgi:transposase-like protein